MRGFHRQVKWELKVIEVTDGGNLDTSLAAPDWSNPNIRNALSEGWEPIGVESGGIYSRVILRRQKVGY